MLMWAMSDRAIPRSSRTMEGFGVHTFRLYDADGATTLVKFHWKPVAGIHGLVWEESQKLGGIDPDFHRRDLWDAIEAGAFPQWDLGVQVMPDTEDQTFEGIDLLDPTKLVPEELAPVRLGRAPDPRPQPDELLRRDRAGRVLHGPRAPGHRLHRRPAAAGPHLLLPRHPAHPPGRPELRADPDQPARAPVNDNNRDGFGQQAIHEGVAAYTPNSLGGGCPFHVGADGLRHVPRCGRR